LKIALKKKKAAGLKDTPEYQSLELELKKRELAEEERKLKEVM
jgi:hypothetical protein